ncbi:hypothetical protein MBGDC06_00612 [Thermoplasmatales archaeon SCGC AB-539-C06]|nr:hypothetical protein MBGDC06_00612 [Thermoplasmatales archaeon SCGC AB-539-C06]
MRTNKRRFHWFRSDYNNNSTTNSINHFEHSTSLKKNFLEIFFAKNMGEKIFTNKRLLALIICFKHILLHLLHFFSDISVFPNNTFLKILKILYNCSYKYICWMEEVFFWDNPNSKPNKTAMYNRYQSIPRWTVLLKVFEDKYSDYKKKRYSVYVYRSLPYPPESKVKKNLRSKFLI